MPGLHISLGVFNHLFELLEGSCKKLDLALAQHSSQPHTLYSFRLYSDTLHSFSFYSAALQKVAKLEEDIRKEAEAAEQLTTYLALKEYPQSQVEYWDGAVKLRQHIDSLVCYLISHNT